MAERVALRERRSHRPAAVERRREGCAERGHGRDVIRVRAASAIARRRGAGGCPRAAGGCPRVGGRRPGRSPGAGVRARRGEPREDGALQGNGDRRRHGLRRRIGLRRARERRAGRGRPPDRLGEEERPQRRRHGRPGREVDRGLRGARRGGPIGGGEEPWRLGVGRRAIAGGVALRGAIEQRGAVALRREELGDAGALPVAAGGDGDLALDHLDGRRARVDRERHPDPPRLSPARGVREPGPGAPRELAHDGAAGANHDARRAVRARPEGDAQHVRAGRVEPEPPAGPERAPGRGALEGREIGAFAASAQLDLPRDEVRLDERPEEQRFLEVARGEPCGGVGREGRGGRCARRA
ncbi:hypothetical protein [Sorangium cellulosum]|uniref:hypothetical protein n=1 Tax=Sorangium cellulosum TaxID=56 RepID=UPI00101A0700|nr:hypothetical protein [Sorangium cellulosum]